MDDLIEALIKAAKELFEQAEALEGVLDDGTSSIDSRKIALIETLRSICASLGIVHTNLTDERGPLFKLIRRIDGIEIGDALRRVERFFEEHEEAIERIGVCPESAKKAVRRMRARVERKGWKRFFRPETLDAEGAVGALADLRDLVCKLSQMADVYELLATPKLLKGVVEGATGAAIVVVDVTGAVTAFSNALFSEWVLFKAVKSIWTGTKMVRNAVQCVTDAIDTLKWQRAETEEECRRSGDETPPTVPDPVATKLPPPIFKFKLRPPNAGGPEQPPKSEDKQ